MNSYILHVLAESCSNPDHIHPRLATIPRGEAIAAEGVALPPASQHRAPRRKKFSTGHWSSLGETAFVVPPIATFAVPGTLKGTTKVNQQRYVAEDIALSQNGARRAGQRGKLLSAAHFRKCSAVWLLQAR